MFTPFLAAMTWSPSKYAARCSNSVKSYTVFRARCEPNKRWMFEDGPIGWDQVLKRWKARGPMNGDYVSRLQKGYRSRMAVSA